MIGTPSTAHFQVPSGTSRGIRSSEPPTHPRRVTLQTLGTSEQPAATWTAWLANSELSQNAAGPGRGGADQERLWF